jgi:hypothetical protein
MSLRAGGVAISQNMHVIASRRHGNLTEHALNLQKISHPLIFADKQKSMDLQIHQVFYIKSPLFHGF